MKLKFWEKEEQPKLEYLDIEFVMLALAAKLYQFTVEEMARKVVELKNKLNLKLVSGLTVHSDDEEVRKDAEAIVYEWTENSRLDVVAVKIFDDQKEEVYERIRRLVRYYLRRNPELKPTIDAVLAEIGLPIQTDDLMAEQTSERRG